MRHLTVVDEDNKVSIEYNFFNRNLKYNNLNTQLGNWNYHKTRSGQISK